MLVGFAVLAFLFLTMSVGAWRRRRRVHSLIAMLVAALSLSTAALCGTIAVGIRGYRALTREEVAARITTEPLGPQRFRATVALADSSVRMYDLAGDAVYVDAHVLKWRPIANILGLHTVYELDRISGRYQRLADEQQRPRTVYSVARAKPFNTFNLARRYWVFRPFVDAEYGSATFIGATVPATYEIRVSTTGLLVRPLGAR